MGFDRRVLHSENKILHDLYLMGSTMIYAVGRLAVFSIVVVFVL